MKSFENLVKELYGGILSDIALTTPNLRQGLERDYSRLLSSLDTRGLPFFTIDLPAFGKHFDKCLANGLLTRMDCPQMRPFKRGTVIPRLFKGLLLQVFETHGGLRQDPDIQAIRALRQLYQAAKKLRMECTNERTWKQVRSFFEVEASLRSGSLGWDYDELGWTGKDSLSFRDCLPDPHDPQGAFAFLQEDAPVTADAIDNLQAVSDIITAELGFFDPNTWQTKHGPGAVSDMKVAVQSKYDFPTWPDKLARVFPLDVFAFANYGLWADYVSGLYDTERFVRSEVPSILVCVPKTQKGPRLIAKEPTCHQWTQQAIKDYFVNRLRETSISQVISFDDQTVNQRWAQRASITGEHMTVDLSDASDRVTCWSIERLFRRNESLLLALHATRTRWVANPIDKNSPSFHKLRKFSCMGSACTFPVQSVFFACVAISCVLTVRRKKPTTKNISWAAGEVRVFGDDMIVPTDVGACLEEVLTYLQLKVNRDKTFGTGKFRESCGFDAFDGHDVTPTYIMSLPSRLQPESVVSFIESANNFFRSFWPMTFERLKRTSVRNIPSGIPNVEADSGDFGWIDHKGIGNPHLRKRRGPDTQVVEYLTTIPYRNVRKIADRGCSSLLQYFTEDPEPHHKWEAGRVPNARKAVFRRTWKAMN